MNSESKFPMLCKAKPFLHLAQQAVVPTWRHLIADENLQFIVSSDEEKDALGLLLETPADLGDRTWGSADAFAAENKSFALLSCDGSEPVPSDWSPQSEIIRITLANRRLHPDLKEFLKLPFAQSSDLIVSDYLPEESNLNGGSPDEEVSLASLPRSFAFSAPSVPSLAPRSASAEGPLLWVVDSSSMVSGLINEKVASILGKMQQDKGLEVICIEPDVSSGLNLADSLSKARAILAVTGDPVLGHFLVRAACQLGIPVIFPIEEPCSPFRFTADELDHYSACNNYGRAGLSTRGLLAKAVEYARNGVGEKASGQTGEQPTEAPGALWMRLIEARKGSHPTPLPSPNGHEITRIEAQGDFEPAPDFKVPQVTDTHFEISLTPRPWMTHPSFTQSILALLARSEIPESIPLTQKIADLLTEHLLALKPTPELASRLIRNLALRDPEWLERVRKDLARWSATGVILDVARAIQASHPDVSESNGESLAARRLEFQGVANLLIQQVNSHIVSPHMPNPLFRFLTALDLVEEQMEVILKVFAAHPPNERLYRAMLNFWGLVNGNPEACQTLVPAYNDSSNLNLSQGHLFLLLGIASESLPEVEESVARSLSMGYWKRWIDGSPWDRVLAAFVLALIGLEEEAKKQFEETISAHSHFSPLSHFFSKVPELRSSGGTPISDNLREDVRKALQTKE